MTEEGEAPDAGREDRDGGSADGEAAEGPSAAGTDRDDEGPQPAPDRDRAAGEPADRSSADDDESESTDGDDGGEPGGDGSQTGARGATSGRRDDAGEDGGSGEAASGTVGGGDPSGGPSEDGANGDARAGEGPGAGVVERDEHVPADEEDVRPNVDDAVPGGADESAAATGEGRGGSPSGSDRSAGGDPHGSSADPGDAEAVGGGMAAGQAEVRGEVDGEPDLEGAGGPADAAPEDVPEDVRRYDRFQKVDRASYDRVNEFLRDRTYITAREWAIARLCADFRTATGVEMTKIGENLPHLVPFMTDTYSPQAVNQARSAFEEKVRTAGATFLYGAMSGFFTADELDEIMYEVTEVAKFLLEVEGVELTVDEELDAEDRISAVMREVRQASEELRHEEVECPECGHTIHGTGPDAGTE